jgi:hypothetical protein
MYLPEGFPRLCLRKDFAGKDSYRKTGSARPFGNGRKPQGAQREDEGISKNGELR